MRSNFWIDDLPNEYIFHMLYLGLSSLPVSVANEFYSLVRDPPTRHIITGGNWNPGHGGTNSSDISDIFIFKTNFRSSQPSEVVSTHLWNTPLNLYQQAIKGFLS